MAWQQGGVPILALSSTDFEAMALLENGSVRVYLKGNLHDAGARGAMGYLIGYLAARGYRRVSFDLAGLTE
jgi:hypothetical protein